MCWPKGLRVLKGFVAGGLVQLILLKKAKWQGDGRDQRVVNGGEVALGTAVFPGGMRRLDGGARFSLVCEL